jgi:hypothetical protein
MTTFYDNDITSHLIFIVLWQIKGFIKLLDLDLQPASHIPFNLR